MNFSKPLALSLGLVAASLTWANSTPTQVRQTEASAQKLAQQVQAQVDKLDAKRQADFNAWRQAKHELMALEAYNQRQAKWNNSLETELTSLGEQLNSLDTTRAELEPLLEQMLTRLTEFTRYDLPFNTIAKETKLASLEQLLQRVDVSLAEKLRQLLTSYRQEVEAGRSLEVNQEFIQVAGNPSASRHSLLRLGRLGLYALSEDTTQGYVWQAQQKIWQELNPSQTKQLKQAIYLAETQGLPQLLQLPLSLSLNSAVSSQGDN